VGACSAPQTRPLAGFLGKVLGKGTGGKKGREEEIKGGEKKRGSRAWKGGS